MIKRLYKRFLLWVLSPVLKPAQEEMIESQAQVFAIKDGVASLSQVNVSQNI